MVKWTKEQEDAIYTEGRDILVAAAAGSGKTAVLVERIIQKLLREENPLNIDELLVVTFTNAAAQEMRNRVGLALDKALKENPGSLHLKKQLSLLQRASISTLHSFCLDIVRQYSYLLDIDPAFRIADDMETDLIKQEVMDELFEEWYGREGEEQEQFFAVVDRFSSDRSDEEVEKLILALHNFAIQNPWPEEWLKSLADRYVVPDEWEEADLSWLPIMKREVQHQLEAMRQEIVLAYEITKEPDGPYAYAETVEADLALVEEAEKHVTSWSTLQHIISTSKFPALSRKKQDCNEEKKEQVKNLRNSYKDRWSNMKAKWFARSLEGHVEDLKTMAPVVRHVTKMVMEFHDRFVAAKKEKAIVDFSDLEHYCLQLLLDESATKDHLLPSKVAVQLQEQFKEVLVDEYQDTNLVQETILSLVSDQKGPGNRFMVGDVKQSIYRFRHAEPFLFIEKYKQFSGENSKGQRIDLASNFRSRELVLTGANYIFRQILDETVGEINYDEKAELIYGNKMYDEYTFSSPDPELVIIDRDSEEEEEEETEGESVADLEKAQIEARAYADRIHTWIGKKGEEPLQVFDKEKGIQRDIQYRDIVILLRSMNWAPTIVDELKKQGIPVYAELDTGYFEAIEIKIMISLLKVIDNPRQDIPLASVLKSPIVGLSEDELVRIRLADKHGTYYDALEKYTNAHHDGIAQRLKRFLRQLEEFRLQARNGALSELIWNIYQETGYYDFVGGIPGGRQRQVNLRALYDRARAYESTSFRGLFRFLRFIDKMREKGDDLGAARALSEQEDVVRIMTIHKSKGLEFPVVIIGAMDKQFNMQDLSRKYLLHKDLGFASKYIDPEKRITYPTLFYHALKGEKKRELLAEEMRVLYVAVTRAKEKLVMIANVNSFAKKIEKWQKMIDHSEWVLPAYFRMEAKSYLDWIGPALMRHENNAALRKKELSDRVLEPIRLDPSKWEIAVENATKYTDMENDTGKEQEQLKEHINQWKPVTTEDEALAKQVDERLSYRYPHEVAAKTRAKQTVTEIKRQREIRDEYSSDQLVQPYRAPIVRRPNFIQKEKMLTAAEIGTAMHTVMQHLPMDKPLNEEQLEEQLELFVAKEILTTEEARAIDRNAIIRFFETDIARLMMEKASSLEREVPFSFTLSADEVYSRWQGGEERVLIQGVIDCLIPKEDGWIILDYKTDAIPDEVTDETIAMLKKRYEVQLNLYRKALERIWKQPIKQTYVYYFQKQLLLEVPQK